MGAPYPICHVSSPTFSGLLPGGTDHFGFLYHDDRRAFCDELRAQGVRLPLPLKEGVGGRWLCDVAAPDGVGIELMQG
jgi:catechol 2,3-dioxygenase-like lactoylglutathione lyase family enzyme